MPDKHFILLGAGGHARSLISLIRRNGDGIECIIDNNARIGETIMDVPVDVALKGRTSPLILAIGDNENRKIEFFEHKSALVSEPIIHDEAYVDGTALLSVGTQVFCRAYIGPMVRINENTIINTHAVVEHEAAVGAHSHIATGAILLGRSSVGSHCFIGAGTVVRDGVTICNDVTVGANSFVNQNITSPGCYVGSPAKRLNK